MTEDLIFGIKNAAKYLGIGERTAHRFFKERKDFPKPIREEHEGRHCWRWWKKEDLEQFKKLLEEEKNNRLGKAGKPLGKYIFH